MYQNIFFDLDGTLVNTEDGIQNGIEYARTQLDLPQVLLSTCPLKPITDWTVKLHWKLWMFTAGITMRKDNWNALSMMGFYPF